MNPFRHRDPRLLRAAIGCAVLAALCFYAGGFVHCQEETPRPPVFKAAIGTYVGFAVIDAVRRGR